MTLGKVQKEGERERSGAAIGGSAVEADCSTDSQTWEWREDQRTYEVKGMRTVFLFWKKGDKRMRKLQRVPGPSRV